jgi:hypothetical protein
LREKWYVTEYFPKNISWISLRRVQVVQKLTSTIATTENLLKAEKTFSQSWFTISICLRRMLNLEDIAGAHFERPERGHKTV